MDERYIIGRTFIISEEQLNYLIDRNISYIKEWRYYNNFECFEEEYPDHSFGFGWLSKEITGLPVHIILDESGDYVRSKHPMFLYVVVESSDNDVYIPILVHRFKPILLDEKYSRNIDGKTFEKVQHFIRTHYHIISEYANGRVEYGQLKASTMRKNINEGLLTEMPKFMTYEVDLPTDIWIDTKRGLNHTKRIKFKDRNNNNTDTWASMTIDKFKPEVYNLLDKTFLSPKDISLVRDFVRVNYETLMMSANGDLKDKDDILSRLICHRDIESLVQDDNKIVNVDFSSIGYRLLFNVDDKEISRKFIKELSKHALFDYVDEVTVQLNDFKLIGDTYTKSEIIKNAFYGVGKKLMVKINFMESTKLERTIEYIDNNKTKIK